MSETVINRPAKIKAHNTIKGKGLMIERIFTQAGTHPYDAVKWERRDVVQSNWKTGETVFEQHGVEFPETWSVNASMIVTTKYFRGAVGAENREWSLKQVIDRVVLTYTKAGKENGYFATDADAEIFEHELTHMLLHQIFAYNSPVWFNVGTTSPQQVSACFILSVDDTMESILNWYREEGMIFKGGSGAGLNLSRIRSSKELLKSGGTASGPVSFMRGADASAGTIKSGGATRRAAKMVVLDVAHPDIEEFIETKVNEENKIRALRDAGFDMDLGGKDIISVQYQNANNSVRVSDEFMRAVEKGEQFGLKAIATGEVIESVDARTLFTKMAQAAWACADPGIQYDDTINDWHTNPETGRINASNPCSEYMSLDNSSCNLASLNLMKFLKSDGSFDAKTFGRACELIITSMDISICFADFPTEAIGDTTKAYRQLGIGYANLGALLMASGLAYDSEGGRALAGAISSLMTGITYKRSAELAGIVGPYAGFAQNAQPHARVMRKHAAASSSAKSETTLDRDVWSEANKAWDSCLATGDKNGWRNAQISVLAPTGTIGLMMDCDTTGIEPDLGLVKFKKLVGGGNMTIVNQTVPRALNQLGYEAPVVDRIVAYIDENKTIVGSPDLKSEHLPVFACSMGDNTIHYEGHVRMMGATQPFLSGAISKTVNMPQEATIEEIEELHMLSWELGVKAVAVYRDNCKVGQPLSTMKKDGEQGSSTGGDASGAAKQVVERIVERVVHQPVREKLPRSRRGRTFEFRVADCKGFATIGEYSDGRPGEVFLTVSKQGSTLAGIMDAFAKSISYGLQYGVPMRAFIEAFVNTRFEPAGMTDDPDIRMASSIVDYLFRRLAVEYLTTDERAELGIYTREERLQPTLPGVEESITHTMQGTDVFADPKTIPSASDLVAQIDAGTYSAPPSHGVKKAAGTGMICSACGSANMQRAGACYVCGDCGSSSGCS